MGLLEQEIKELRQMNKQIMDGSIKPDEVSQRIAVYTQTEKRAKMMLQAFALQAKHGKRAMNPITSKDLIGDGSVIDMNTDVETDVVSCPDLERNITRHECLDYSGDKEHVASCISCKNFNTTRRLLMKD